MPGQHCEVLNLAVARAAGSGASKGFEARHDIADRPPGRRGGPWHRQ